MQAADNIVSIKSFTRRKFKSHLAACEKNAPDPDSITYAYLKLISPGIEVLTIIYSICLKF